MDKITRKMFSNIIPVLFQSTGISLLHHCHEQTKYWITIGSEMVVFKVNMMLLEPLQKVI